MTIQVSVTIWTILCFTALYWILRKLLFEPILEVMDRRQKKIADAAAAAAEVRRQQAEAAQLAAADREARRLQARQAAEAEAEAARGESRQLLEKAKKERVAVVTAYRAGMKEQYERDLEAAAAPIRQIADSFLTHLFQSEP